MTSIKTYFNHFEYEIKHLFLKLSISVIKGLMLCLKVKELSLAIIITLLVFPLLFMTVPLNY